MRNQCEFERIQKETKEKEINHFINTEPNSNKKEQTKQIGNYIIGTEIGSGAFGKVVIGYHILTGETVAIKILDKLILQNTPDDFELVHQEIEILKIVKHKNIVQLYEIIETLKHIYIIMEYCDGKDLMKYILSKSHLTELESLKFFQQLINALVYLHSQNIAHRDIKIDNMLLDIKNNLKLVDFGLSTKYSDEELLNQPCGTVVYAAPEVLKGNEYHGMMADVWSSGIVLFGMLSGFLPFCDEDDEINKKDVIKTKIEIPKSFSPMVTDLLTHMLDKNPMNRYTLKDIQDHPWFKLTKYKMIPGVIIGENRVPIDDKILNMLPAFGLKKEKVKINLINNKFNHGTALYYLLVRKLKSLGNESVSDWCSDGFVDFIKREYIYMYHNKYKCDKSSSGSLIEEEKNANIRETKNFSKKKYISTIKDMKKDDLNEMRRYKENGYNDVNIKKIIPSNSKKGSAKNKRKQINKSTDLTGTGNGTKYSDSVSKTCKHSKSNKKDSKSKYLDYHNFSKKKRAIGNYSVGSELNKKDNIKYNLKEISLDKNNKNNKKYNKSSSVPNFKNKKQKKYTQEEINAITTRLYTTSNSQSKEFILSLKQLSLSIPFAPIPFTVRNKKHGPLHNSKVKHLDSSVIHYRNRSPNSQRESSYTPKRDKLTKKPKFAKFQIKKKNYKGSKNQRNKHNNNNFPIKTINGNNLLLTNNFTKISVPEENPQKKQNTYIRVKHHNKSHSITSLNKSESCNQTEPNVNIIPINNFDFAKSLKNQKETIISLRTLPKNCFNMSISSIAQSTIAGSGNCLNAFASLYEGPIDINCIVEQNKTLEDCIRFISKKLDRQNILYLNPKPNKFRCTKNGQSCEIEIVRIPTCLKGDVLYYYKIKSRQGDVLSYRNFTKILFDSAKIILINK